MLRRLAQKIWVQAIFYFLLVLAVAYFLSWIFGLSGQIPCQETGAQHTNCPRYNLVLVALWQITELANWSAPAITVIATFFIALFTLSLWESGESNIKILR